MGREGRPEHQSMVKLYDTSWYGEAKDEEEEEEEEEGEEEEAFSQIRCFVKKKKWL